MHRQTPCSQLGPLARRLPGAHKNSVLDETRPRLEGRRAEPLAVSPPAKASFCLLGFSLQVSSLANSLSVPVLVAVQSQTVLLSGMVLVICTHVSQLAW